MAPRIRRVQGSRSPVERAEALGELPARQAFVPRQMKCSRRTIEQNIDQSPGSISRVQGRAEFVREQVHTPARLYRGTQHVRRPPPAIGARADQQGHAHDGSTRSQDRPLAVNLGGSINRQGSRRVLGTIGSAETVEHQVRGHVQAPSVE